MIQGSKEWHEIRRNHIGASDAPVIMGVSPWKKPIDLWKEKLGLTPPQKTTGPMIYGKQTEEIARDWFNKKIERFFQPEVHFHSEIKFLMASLDGFCEIYHESLEIE